MPGTVDLTLHKVMRWSDDMTIEETIDKALEAGRIVTDMLREERAVRLITRHEWAMERWESIRPRKLTI